MASHSFETWLKLCKMPNVSTAACKRFLWISASAAERHAQGSKRRSQKCIPYYLYCVIFRRPNMIICVCEGACLFLSLMHWGTVNLCDSVISHLFLALDQTTVQKQISINLDLLPMSVSLTWTTAAAMCSYMQRRTRIQTTDRHYMYCMWMCSCQYNTQRTHRSCDAFEVESERPWSLPWKRQGGRLR